jgi:hypothetical protein
MRRRAIGWTLSIGLLAAAASQAEPLEEVRSRLAALQSDQPIRLVVDVQIQHRGTAPLHYNKVTERGTARFAYGPDGVKSLTQKWNKGTTHASIWTSGNPDDSDIPLLDFEEAESIANPAGALVTLLQDATLVSDSPAEWEGKAARLLVVRPAQLSEPEAAAAGSPATRRNPFSGEVKLWLDESGAPLGLEGALALRLGPAIQATQLHKVTFQQVEGRLLAAEIQEDFESTALAVLRGRDTRTLKIGVDRR